MKPKERQQLIPEGKNRRAVVVRWLLLPVAMATDNRSRTHGREEHKRR